MKKFEFVCEQHEDYGENGWRLLSQPGFDPLPGMAVAHDVFEHFPDGDDSPADEFQALGASYLIRGESDYWVGSNHPAPVHIASDFPMILSHIVGYNMSLPSPVPFPRKLDSIAEDALCDIIKHARKNIEDEWELSSDDPRYSVSKETLDGYLNAALGWMRIGYRRAKKRYGDKLWRVSRQFVEVQERADQLLKHADEGMVMEIILRGDFVSVHIQEPEWEAA